MQKTDLEPTPLTPQVRARYVGDPMTLLARLAEDPFRTYVKDYIIARFHDPQVVPVWADELRDRPVCVLDDGNVNDFRPRNGRFYNIWSQYLFRDGILTTGQLVYRSGSYPGFEFLGTPGKDNVRGNIAMKANVFGIINLTGTRTSEWRIR